MRVGLIISTCVASSGLSLGGAAAFAHHSVTASFDSSRQVEVRGTLVEFKLRSPHSSLVIDGHQFVDGVQQGTAVERWEIESSAAPNLRQQGITETSLKPGDAITVRGSPHRDPNLHRMNAFNFTVPGVTPQGRGGGGGRAAGPGRGAGALVAAPAVAETGFRRIAGRWRPPFQRNGERPALELNAAGQAAWDDYDQTKSPANTCEPMTPPDVNNAPGYFMDIRFGEGQVVVRNQAYDLVRTIPLDGSEAPADPKGALGIVRGRIDGDQLIVDSRGYPPSLWGLGAATQVHGAGADIPSSAQKVLTERFSVSADGQTLSYEYTLNDPVYMSRPHTSRIQLARVADDTPMYAYDCNVDAASMFSRPAGESLLERGPQPAR